MHHFPDTIHTCTKHIFEVGRVDQLVDGTVVCSETASDWKKSQIRLKVSGSSNLGLIWVETSSAESLYCSVWGFEMK